VILGVTQRLEVRLRSGGKVDQDPPLALLKESSAIDRINIDRINTEALGEGHEAGRVRSRLGRFLSHPLISTLCQAPGRTGSRRHAVVAKAGPVPLGFIVVFPIGRDDGIDDLTAQQAFPSG
jgi:hypothetical protein